MTTPTAAAARPTSSLFFTTAMRPMHTTGALRYPEDPEAEALRAQRRKQLEEEIKQGKLPEVEPEEKFSPESIIKRSREIKDGDAGKEEDLPRASQKQKVKKPVSDDFADENSGISDAQMKPEKTLHVHDAPPMKRGEREDSVVSQSLGDNFVDGGVGSKNRAKMNASEHHQKYTARGNLNGMERNPNNTSTKSAASKSEKITHGGLSDIERSFTSDQAMHGSDLGGSLSEEGGKHKNPEWSSASSSTNTSWVADNQQPFSTYTDPKSEKRQERFSTRAPGSASTNAGATSSFPQGGYQKRSYATEKKNKDEQAALYDKNEAIIGDSPIPQRPASLSSDSDKPAESHSYSTSKSFSASSDTTASSKRFPQTGNIEMADFVGEPRMMDDDKGKQAKENEARFGRGWQNRIKDLDQDYASSGASGAPAHGTREKPVNYRRSYSTTPAHNHCEITAERPLGWRVGRAQGANFGINL